MEKLQSFRKRLIICSLTLFSILFFKPCPALAESGLGFDTGYQKVYEIGRAEKSYARDFEAEMERVSAITEEVDLNEEPGAIRWYRDFNFSTVYTDNMRNTRNDTKDDFAYIYAPTIGFEKGRSGVTKSYLNTFYRISYYDFIENQKLSRFNHLISSEGSYRFQKLKINLSNDFRPLSAQDSTDREEFITSASSTQTVSYSDRFSASAQYEFTPKLNFSQKYDYKIDYFPASANLGNRAVQRNSSQIHTFTSSLNYQWSPKLSLNTAYAFSTTDYFKGGVFAKKTHSVSLGTSYYLSAKMGLTGQVAFLHRDYNQPLFTSIESFTYRVAGFRKLTEKISLTVFTGTSEGETFDLDTGSAIAREGVIYGMSVNWQMSRNMRLSVSPSVAFSEKEDYITLADTENPSLFFTRGQEDETYSVDVDWTWLRGPWEYYLGYEFKNKNSTFKNFEYNSQKVIGALKYIF